MFSTISMHWVMIGLSVITIVGLVYFNARRDNQVEMKEEILPLSSASTKSETKPAPRLAHTFVPPVLKVTPAFPAVPRGKHRAEVQTEDGLDMYKILGQVRNGRARIRRFGHGDAPVIQCKLI